MNTLDQFRLDNKVAIITGGSGLLGVKHAEAIAEAKGIPILWDINADTAESCAQEIAQLYGGQCLGMQVDITELSSITEALDKVLSALGTVDILINNAAHDPKIGPDESLAWSRLENFALEMWQKDMAIGLTGAFLCSQVVGSHLARQQRGVILNVASDLGVIAPDQRIYRKEEMAEDEQPVKPVTYSVVKHGLIGLTKYLATYWAENNVRVNSISPGGVYTNQPDDFVEKLTNLIPMGRMAHRDEYKAAVIFLISDASSYMTGSNLSMDGGRSCW